MLCSSQQKLSEGLSIISFLVKTDFQNSRRNITLGNRATRRTINPRSVSRETRSESRFWDSSRPLYRDRFRIQTRSYQLRSPIDPSGKFFVSLNLKTRRESIKILPLSESAVGIDVGVSTYITTSEGTKIENPRVLDKHLKKLARLQRKISRQTQVAKKTKTPLDQAKNYQKTKIRIARLHEKIRNIRRDHIHKSSWGLVKSYQTICFEDLGIEDMLKNPSLARSVSDASWGELIRQIEYKSDWYGREFVKVGRHFPSTQICSGCGSKQGPKTIGVRSWDCSCGASHDRDMNAARNILIEGLRVKSNRV